MQIALRQRERVTLELKNGTSIQGVLIGMDFGMNAHLKDAKIKVKGKNRVKVQLLYIRGANINYVIFAHTLNLETILYETYGDKSINPEVEKDKKRAKEREEALRKQKRMIRLESTLKSVYS